MPLMQRQIHWRLHLLLSWALILAFPNSLRGAITTVICVGDSITAGYGATKSYPAQLGTLLGTNYSVGEFGELGATALKSGDVSYWQSTQFTNSLDSLPDVVVLMLGSNDSKPGNWRGAEPFASDIRDLIAVYGNLPTHPRVYLCTPPSVYHSGAYGITSESVNGKVVPQTKRVAIETGCTLIDVNAGTRNMPDNFPDNLHPNDLGAGFIAHLVQYAVTGLVPLEPSNVHAASAPGGVILSWDTSEGATGYAIRRSTHSGGPYSTIANQVTDVPFVDSNVVACIEYHYVITAFNSSGESLTDSAEATANTGALIANCGVSAPIGLVSWWTANGTADDSVGSSDAKFYNGGGYAPGAVQQAFAFNGVDHFVSAPYNPAWAFGNDSFTLELWVNFYSTSGRRALLACDAGSGSLKKWIFWLTGGGLQFYANGPNPGRIVSAPFSPMIGQWYHLALTREKEVFTFYIDGAPHSSAKAVVTIPSPNAPLTIGAAEGNFYLNGLVDDVRIYGRALTPWEIQAIHEAGSSGMCPASPIPLVCTPSFDGSGGFVFRASLRSGQSYRLQVSTNLLSTSWTTLSNFVAGPEPTFSFTHPIAGTSKAHFYRILSQ